MFVINITTSIYILKLISANPRLHPNHQTPNRFNNNVYYIFCLPSINAIIFIIFIIMIFQIFLSATFFSCYFNFFSLF